MEPKYRVNISHELEEFIKYPKKPRLRLISLIVLLWLLYTGVTSLRSGRTRTGLFLLAFVAVCSPIYAYIYLLPRTSKYVRRLNKTGPVLFFEDHFETQGQSGQGSYAYKRLKTIRETETEFYLTVAFGHDVIIQKVDCSGELISFLHDLKNRHGG